MSTFVYLVRDDLRDNATDYVNEILTKLQQRGAKITSVTASMSHGDSSGPSYLCVIAYESPAAIAI